MDRLREPSRNCLSESLEIGPQNTVALPMPMREASPLGLKRRLQIDGAGCHTRLQGCSYVVVKRSSRPCQCNSADVQALDPDDVAIVQLTHE